MGLLLRQVLRTLCGVNQWCYAVFWKIGCQNPKLLIWEECHYEPSSCSAELEGNWSSDIHSLQLGIQAGDRVHFLINKMMMNNHVNVVGEGIVGRAAFTGSHEWILANSYIGDSHPPEVLNEVHHQFSAGMQTIAVIPACPHGVVQLGSTLAIMENMGFVNNVRSLILQLGCVPGALLSESHTENEPTETFGVPISPGLPVPVHLTGNYKVPNYTPLLAESCKQQSISSQASRIVGQSSCSQIREIQKNSVSAASTFQTSNLAKILAKSCDGHCEPKITPLMKPGDPFRGQLENGVVGAEVIRSNPDAWLKPQSASYNLRPGLSHQPIICQSDSNNGILTLLEQQFSGAGVQNHDSNHTNASDGFPMPYMRTNGGLILRSHGDSLTSGKELHHRVSTHIKPTSNLCSRLNPQKLTDINLSSMHLAGVALQNIDSSRAEGIPLSSLVDQLGASGILSGGSNHMYQSTDVKHAKAEAAERKQKMDNDLFQAVKIPSTQLDEHIHTSVGEQIPGSIHDCLMNARGSQSITVNAKCEDPCAQPPSGDDLYDILGADFKNKLLNGKYNSLLVDGPHAKAQNVGKDASTFMNMQDASSDFYSVNEGISDGSIFSVMSTDHLLEAVVSKAQSTAKQSSDDNVSCRTTLKKISSSSGPSVSPSYGWVRMSDQVQRELFDLPKSLEKAGTVASGSFRTGCSNDDKGSCSQTTSIYGSQLSSWVEQGHNVRRDSSVLTAFSKKNDETSKPNRKRLKPGENPRPRPKDRQMIQDRVKELREIVPNGAKCSIDALLERTIKHMLFLQSVTKHADKLKQTGESKMVNKEDGLLLKDNFEGGATWAFEVGSQSMVCPIIVEDLNPPRQMLVEMLCEERGFFLEIADLIRGLGLTILKGVMEARNDKIWARFAVEANRDVTRMEIFMSLVRLLEQTVKGSASLANAVESNNMMVHHAFPPATSIAATGRPSSLQ